MVKEIPFDISAFISEKGTKKKQSSKEKYQVNTTTDFKDLVRQVVKYLGDKISDTKTTEEERSDRQRIEHNATLGDEEAMHMMIAEIQEYIRNHKIQNVEHPSMFPSLSRAIFEYVYRFKIFYKWSLFHESPSAHISGKEMWFYNNGDFEKQEEEFDSVEEVEEIIRLLMQVNPNFKIDKSNPEDELDLPDGTRITVTIPPRTLVPTIVFRKFIVRNFSFDEQIKRHTIAQEDRTLFKSLASAKLNIVIAGGVQSGKSTLLKTFYAERPSNLIALVIEGHSELYLKRDFPDRLVHEFSINDAIGNGKFDKTLRTILRFDHDYVIFQEVRGVEAESAIDRANRGATGLLMTYHVTDASKVVEQLAQHIIDEYPNRRRTNEVRRISQTLHLGVTMKEIPSLGNQKRVTSVYEICYDYNEDKAWVQYLIKFNEKEDKWSYSNVLSDQLIYQLDELDPTVSETLIRELTERSKSSRIPDNQLRETIFLREEGG